MCTSSSHEISVKSSLGSSLRAPNAYIFITLNCTFSASFALFMLRFFRESPEHFSQCSHEISVCDQGQKTFSLLPIHTYLPFLLLNFALLGLYLAFLCCLCNSLKSMSPNK